jgi:hypothetical protein
MKTLAFWKAALAASLASLLAACGGSSSGTLPQDVPGFVQPAWASPALLVTPGQSSKSFSLTNCAMSSFSFTSIPSQEQPQMQPVGEPLYTVSLVISASGTLTLNGATATTATIGTLLSYTSNTGAETFRDMQIIASSGAVTRLFLRGNDGMKGGDSYAITQSTMGVNFNMSNGNESGQTSVSCQDFSATSTFALSVPPSDSRTKAVFIAPDQTSRLVWDGSADLQSIGVTTGGRFLNLDQATGIMSLSASTATTATLSPLSISGAAYFNVAESASEYRETWYKQLAEGSTPALEERGVFFNANVPGTLNLFVNLCSSTGPVVGDYCTIPGR